MPTPKNLVWETTTSTSSPFALTTVARSFNDAYGTGGTDVFAAFMYNTSVPGEWMVFTGHLSAASTMVVDTVIEGSNGGSAVAWSAGVKNITCDVQAAKQVVTDLAQTLTNKTLTSPVLDTGVSGTAVATQADMESASSTSLLVTPGRQKYHPGATKGWARWDASGGTPTIITSYNVSSISDNGTGTFAVNWTTSFSNAFYAAVGYVDISGSTNATGQWMQIDSLTASAMNVVVTSVATSSPQDRDYNVVIAFGDQ